MSDQGGAGGAGWQPDPDGRHEYRYWDGSAWTDQVADGGVVSSDPPGDVPTEVTGPAPGTETVIQPLAAPAPAAAPAGPPSGADQAYVPPGAAKKKVPVGILALVGLVVAALVAGLVIFLVGGDDDGGGSSGGTGDFAGSITEDEPFVVRTFDMEGGEAVRVVVQPSDDLDVAITPTVERDLISTRAFASIGGGELDDGELDDETSGYYSDLLSGYDSLFSDALEGQDASADLSDALSDFGDLQEVISDNFPAVAEAGVPLETDDLNGEGETEGFIFVAPLSGQYGVIISGVEGDGDFDAVIETNPPDDSFDAFDADEPVRIREYLEAYDEQRDFLCDEDFFGDEPADVSEIAATICDDEAFADLLSTDFSDDISSDFTSDFSDDFSSDFSSDLSSDFSDDLTLGDPQDPSDFIPDYGTDARFTGLADSCFNGNLADCDQLYSVTPIDASTNSWEGYGATCGGRLPEEHPGQCASLG